MTFDTTNLFSVDKFSGYDREEGGGRANVGVQTTTQFDRGGSVTTVFGQSYQLFGLNSFAVADVTNTALDSGLDKPVSDYVASINYSPNRTYTFSTRARFDEATGSVQRFEAEGRANYDRFSVSLLYGDYAPQPEIGYLTRREGILGTSQHQAGVKLGADGSRPLGSHLEPNQPIRHRRRLCGRLLHTGSQLRHILFVCHDHLAANPRSCFYATARPADDCQYKHAIEQRRHLRTDDLPACRGSNSNRLIRRI